MFGVEDLGGFGVDEPSSDESEPIDDGVKYVEAEPPFDVQRPSCSANSFRS